MNLRLSHHGNGKRLPKLMQEYIRKRFILTPEYVKLLRCFEYEGTVGEKNVQRFRIYHAKEAEQNRIQIRNINDLDKHPVLVLFEGYIDQSGTVYAADRRTPKKLKN